MHEPITANCPVLPHNPTPATQPKTNAPASPAATLAQDNSAFAHSDSASAQGSSAFAQGSSAFAHSDPASAQSSSALAHSDPASAQSSAAFAHSDPASAPNTSAFAQGAAPAPASKPRGFQLISKQQHRLIASRGGKAAHASGLAHEYTPAEALLAGQKGGVSVSRNREHMAEIGRKGARSRIRLRAEKAGAAIPAAS